MRSVLLIAALALAFLAGWWGRGSWERGASDVPPVHESSDLDPPGKKPLLEGLRRNADAPAAPAESPENPAGAQEPPADDGAAPGTPDEGPPTALGEARALMARLRPLLLRGKPGHLDLWRLLEAVAADEESNEWLLGASPETAAARHVWAQFLARQEDEVAAFLEEAFQRMLEQQLDPDDISLEGLWVLAPNLGAHLSAVLPPTRFSATRDTLRRLVLEPELLAEEERSSVRASLDGILAAWASSASAADARRELQRGQTTAREAIALLDRIPPHEVSQHDPTGMLVRLLEETGDWREFQRRLYWLREANGAYGAGDLDRLDAAVLALTKDSHYSDHTKRLQRYLAATSRGGWPDAEAFVAAGLEVGGRGLQHVPLLLQHLRPKAPTRYVRTVLDRYELAAHVRAALKELLKK